MIRPAAALALIALSVAFAPAHAQQVPYVAYGVGLMPGAAVGAYNDGVICGRTVTNAHGRWTLMISTNDACAPSTGDVITFTLNGRTVDETVRWMESGTPALSGYPTATGIPLTLKGTIGIAAVPPHGGMTMTIAGTTSLQALIDAQAFDVESVWVLDIATQQFLRFVTRAPLFVNTLSSVASTDIVTLKSSPDSPPPPAPGEFSVTQVRVTYNGIGTPVANVTIKNLSRTTIDAFDVLLCMRDRDGELVERWGDGDLALTGIVSTAFVAPSGTVTGVWVLYGWELATQVSARPLRSHTTTGAVFESSAPVDPPCP